MRLRHKNDFRLAKTSQAAAKRAFTQSLGQSLGQSSGPKLLLSITASILLGTLTPALAANRPPDPIADLTPEHAISHHKNSDLTITQLSEDLTDILPENLETFSELLSPLLSNILPPDLIPAGIIPDQSFLQFIQQTTELLGTVSDRQAQYALITASALANDNPALVSWLSQLQTSPIGTLSINGLELGDFAEQLTTTIADRDRTIDAIALQSSQAAALEQSPDFGNLPDLRQPGPLSVSTETITVTPQLDGAIAENLGYDADEDAIAAQVDLYVPTVIEQPAAPVIVISHGVGGRRTHFAELAQHLASYGFVVVVPDHRSLPSTPASDTSDAAASPLMAQLTALGERLFGQLSPVEFIQRPLTISAILDQLEQVNTTDPALMDRIDVNNVGIIGHSLGGYTGLALASGDINQKQLKRTCNNSDALALNLSLTLQCQARELPKRIPDLEDSRVKAVMALNPVLSAVLGKKEIADIDVPVMIVTGSHDAIAPMMLEQLPAFSWLTTDHKYLAAMVPGGHASVNRGSTGQNSRLSQITVGPANILGEETTQALSLAFMQANLLSSYDQQVSPDLYLTPAYGQFLSKAGPTLHLVTDLDDMDISSN